MLKWRFWISVWALWLLCAAVASYSAENSCGFAFSYRVAVQTLQITFDHWASDWGHVHKYTDMFLKSVFFYAFGHFCSHTNYVSGQDHIFLGCAAKPQLSELWCFLHNLHTGILFFLFSLLASHGLFANFSFELKLYWQRKTNYLLRMFFCGFWRNCLLPSSGLVALFERLCLCRRGRGYFVELLSWGQDKRRAKTPKNICTTSSPSSTLQSSVWCVDKKVLLQKWVMPLLSTSLCSCTVIHSGLYWPVWSVGFFFFF